MTNWFPSVLWHCWFAHLACKNCPWDDLLCVEWDVKPYTLHLHPGQPTTSPIIYFHRHSLGGVISGGTRNFHSGTTTTDQEVWRTEVPSRVRGRIPGKRSNTVYRFWLQKRPKVENFAQFTSWFVICVSDGGWAAKRQSLWLASTLGLAWYSKRLPLGDLKCNFLSDASKHIHIISTIVCSVAHPPEIQNDWHLATLGRINPQHLMVIVTTVHDTRFHENLLRTFCTIPLTNKQTNTGNYSTSLARVVINWKAFKDSRLQTSNNTETFPHLPEKLIYIFTAYFHYLLRVHLYTSSSVTWKV